MQTVQGDDHIMRAVGKNSGMRFLALPNNFNQRWLKTLSVPQFSTCKSWLLLRVCHTYSILSAFWCSHSTSILVYVCIRTSTLFTCHRAQRLNLKSISETSIFLHPGGPPAMLTLTFMLLQIPCVDHELGIWLLRKVCK